MKIYPFQNKRILVIDDNRAIHEDFRKILGKSSDLALDLSQDEARLFGGKRANSDLLGYEIDSAYQGEEGLALIEKSLEENRPYALAFVDVRMPPGWDGVETTCKIWEKYPDLQVVICTAYSDYSWQEIVDAMGYLDRMVILKKPFDEIEVLQLAVAMTQKWRFNQRTKLRLDNLEKMVQGRNIALQATHIDLTAVTFLLMRETEKAQQIAFARLAELSKS
jgi:CheY-like chemotaxis protein